MSICKEGIVNRESQQIYYVESVVVPKRIFYRCVKRLFDFSIAFFMLFVLIIPMIIIAICICIDSEGSPIFKQERVGKNGKTFVMYKFRSMYINAEEKGAQWANKDDDRCTRVGRIIRKSRIDEFPQLINILIGNMSFVGPRPERANFYEEFEKYIHGFSNRLMVTPGLTGWAQVNGGYDLSPEEKIVYDMEYIKKQSLSMDLKCIFMTIKVVFTQEGAR